MKNKQDKKRMVESLRKTVNDNNTILVTGYEKMTVKQDFELRKIVRKVGGSYQVVNNTIIEKSAKGSPSEELLKGLTGMSSIAYSSGDPMALIRALTDYSKKNPAFTFKAGLVEGRVVDLRGLQELATLPSKQEIYAKLLFLIQSTATRLVSSLNGTGRNIASVLDQGVKETKFKG